uniref:AMP-binding protein n=1 Tax=Eubacterium cellulosolvens TaxID=29322 RepID=UPI0004833CDC|nr:AMP-binding protein [[Eubacterium] cellulosolvens]
MTDTISAILKHAHENFAALTAVKWKKGKNIFEKTYEDLWNDSRSIAGFLRVKGFVRSRVVIIGEASYGWITTYLALTCGGHLAIPLDIALPEGELTELINRSDAEAVFLAPAMEGLSDSIRINCPKVRSVFTLGKEETTPSLISEISANTGNGNATGASVVPATENLSGNESLNDVTEFPVHDCSDEVCTMIFTSGTTGISKGVMLTHRNLAENVASLPVSFEPGIVLLSVLPIHHAYCLTSDWLTGFYYGSCICINDSLMHMVRNMGIFQPDYMLMVPLMLETIAQKLSAFSDEVPKAVIRENVFGKNLKCIFSGGAHLDPYYVDFFRSYGILISEGYGMSECSPVITMNGITEEDNRPGTVGRPIRNAQLKIVDGEIWVKSSSIMKGYYQMPEETSQTITEDGWLRTGDLGAIDGDGYLTITGRVKNLIISSNGENISPEEIENQFALEPMISEIVITGEKNGLAAHIYPNKETAQKEDLLPEQVRESLQKLLDLYNQGQPSYRMITKLILRDQPFIKSSTKKIKRNLVG